MPVLNATTGNIYLSGRIDFDLTPSYDPSTEICTILIADMVTADIASNPLPGAETAAILYKVQPSLDVGTVYTNTQIYSGSPTSYQIGSYNYQTEYAVYSHGYINYLQQALPAISGIIPEYGSVPGTSETLYAYGIPNPGCYSPANTLLLYLPNADISTCSLSLRYFVQQFSGATTSYGYIWSNMSDNYGS
jgi:hypothetical protein